MRTEGGGGSGWAGQGRAGPFHQYFAWPGCHAKAGDRQGGHMGRPHGTATWDVVKSPLHSLLGPAYGPETVTGVTCTQAAAYCQWRRRGSYWAPRVGHLGRQLATAGRRREELPAGRVEEERPAVAAGRRRKDLPSP